MSNTTFSIALCTYNGARFLGEQLESYVAQDRRPDELVVCDDGSTDDTLSILRRFAVTAPFPVRVEVNSTQLGVAGNFGRAIGLCKGQFIALSDQDDIWMAPKLRRIADAFASDSQPGLVFTDAEAIDATGRSLGYRLWDAVRFTRSERRAARRGHLIDVLLRHYVVTGATLAFRSSYRDLVLPIPANCLHDAWIGLLVASVAQTCSMEEPLIGYRQHTTQTSGGERILSLFDQIERAETQTSAVLEETAVRFDLARERLAGTGYALASRSTIDRLEQKVIHFRTRARMRRPGTFRLPLVARELLTARYYRYSHAWKFVAVDLFL